MLGFIKNLFGKGPEDKPTTTAQSPAAPAAPTKSPASAPAAAPPTGETITVSLKGVVDALPAELKGFVTAKPSSSATIKVSLQRVLEGLPKGSVKITYAELKQQGGEGFGGDASMDQTPVSLPLKEVLSQIKPGQFSQRSDQKTIDIPEDIKPVFGADGDAPDHVKSTAASAPAPAAPTPPPAPAPTPAPAPAPTPAAAAPAPAPTPAPAPEPSAPIKSASGLPDPASLRPTAPATPKAAPAPAPAPAAPKPAPTPTPAPAPAPAAAAAPASGGNITSGLEPLFANWPEDLKGELANHNLAGLTISVPVDLVEPMMRKGKIVFPWTQLRSWISPALPSGLGANRDAESLELPLKVVIPLFMAARKPGAAAQKTIAVDKNIPDVFSGKNIPAPAAPAPAPTPAPAVAAPTPAPAPAPAAAPAAPAAAMAGGPSEVLAKAATLPGVEGVVIASQEGLKVASKLPAEFNSDAFAGFVVAMFSRMNQFTGDLKLGEPKALNVQTSNRSLAIVKSGRNFLAVIGKADAVLPVDDLKKLAATLS